MTAWILKAVSAAVLPSALLVECVVLGLVLRRTRAGRFLIVVGVLAQLACLLLPAESWVIRPLEDRFPPVTTMPARLDGVVVLGGTIDELTSADHDTPTLNEAANRLTTFAILARRYPAAKLVFTGGTGQLREGVSTEAEFAHKLLDDLGVAPGRVVFEDRSRTTAENASLTRDLVHPAPGEVWALVTSASHMPRAVGVFRREGWQVLPWPVGYRARTGWFPVSRPLGAKLAVLDAAGHEWIGLFTYWLSGKTGSFMPSPA